MKRDQVHLRDDAAPSEVEAESAVVRHDSVIDTAFRGIAGTLGF